VKINIRQNQSIRELTALHIKTVLLEQISRRNLIKATKKSFGIISIKVLAINSAMR
jgi:hypothetical protein